MITLTPKQQIKKAVMQNKQIKQQIKVALQSDQESLSDTDKILLQTFQNISFVSKKQSKYSFAQSEESQSEFGRFSLLQLILDKPSNQSHDALQK